MPSRTHPWWAAPGPRPRRAERARRVPTSHILLARLLAGILNAAPPLVGSYAMGRDVYGAAASVLAIATIIFGIISQYLSQNLLRLLCTGQRASWRLAQLCCFRC